MRLGKLGEWPQLPFELALSLAAGALLGAVLVQRQAGSGEEHAEPTSAVAAPHPATVPHPSSPATSAPPPPPPATKDPESPFPASCRGFLKTKHTRLAAVYGAYGGRRPVAAVAVSPDGTKLLAGAGENALRLFEVASGKELASIAFEAPRAIVWSHDGKSALVGGESGEIVHLSVPAGERLAAFAKGTAAVTALALSDDGKLACSGHEDGNNFLWTMPEGRQTGQARHPKQIAAIAFSPGDGHYVFVSSADGTFMAWDNQKFQGGRLGLPVRAGLSAFSRDARVCLATGEEERLRLFDLSSLREIVALAATKGGPIWLDISPDRTRAAGVEAGALDLWDLSTGELVDQVSFAGSGDQPGPMAFSPDGKSIVAGTAHGVVLRFALDSPSR